MKCMCSVAPRNAHFLFTWNPKVALISCRLCENNRLSAFGAKNHRLKQKPSTLVIKPNGGERLKTVYTSISQHPKTIQNPTISGAQSIGWTRIRAPHTEKYGTFSPFFTSFSFFQFWLKSTGNRLVAQKRSATLEKWRTTPKVDLYRVCARTANFDFWPKKLKTIDFRWMTLF